MSENNKHICKTNDKHMVNNAPLLYTAYCLNKPNG